MTQDDLLKMEEEVLAPFTLEQQLQIKLTRDAMLADVAKLGDMGALAFALAGATLQVRAEEENWVEDPDKPRIHLQ